MTAPPIAVVELSSAVAVMLVASVVNISCATLGCFLVLRRQSLLGDAISHAVLPGLVIAFLMTGRLDSPAMFASAVLVGLLTAFLTHALATTGDVPEDASMGVVFTSLFAIGVLMLSAFARRADLDPQCVLVGRLEFVPLDTIPFGGWEIPRALRATTATLLATLVFLGFFWKELKIAAFDPALASAMGLSATVTHYLLMAMVAIVTVVAFEAVGSILTVAMLIVPGAAASLLADRLRAMVLWSAAIGVTAAVGGTLAARPLDASEAGMIATIAGVEFALAVAFAPRQGLVSRAINRARLSLRIIEEDILATIYRAEEAGLPASPAELERRGRGPATFWWALARMRRHGWTTKAGEGFALTAKGRDRARSLVRAHRLWESYLEKNLELPLDHLHEPAERVEHFLDPEIQQRLAKEMDLPATDPHGRAIPESETPADKSLPRR